MYKLKFSLESLYSEYISKYKIILRKYNVILVIRGG